MAEALDALVTDNQSARAMYSADPKHIGKRSSAICSSGTCERNTWFCASKAYTTMFASEGALPSPGAAALKGKMETPHQPCHTTIRTAI